MQRKGLPSFFAHGADMHGSPIVAEAAEAAAASKMNFCSNTGTPRRLRARLFQSFWRCICTGPTAVLTSAFMQKNNRSGPQ